MDDSRLRNHFMDSKIHDSSYSVLQRSCDLNDIISSISKGSKLGDIAGLLNGNNSAYAAESPLGYQMVTLAWEYDDYPPDFFCFVLKYRLNGDPFPNEVGPVFGTQVEVPCINGYVYVFWAIAKDTSNQESDESNHVCYTATVAPKGDVTPPVIRDIAYHEVLLAGGYEDFIEVNTDDDEGIQEVLLNGRSSCYKEGNSWYFHAPDPSELGGMVHVDVLDYNGNSAGIGLSLDYLIRNADRDGNNLSGLQEGLQGPGIGGLPEIGLDEQQQAEQNDAIAAADPNNSLDPNNSAYLNNSADPNSGLEDDVDRLVHQYKPGEYACFISVSSSLDFL